MPARVPAVPGTHLLSLKDQNLAFDCGMRIMAWEFNKRAGWRLIVSRCPIETSTIRDQYRPRRVLRYIVVGVLHLADEFGAGIARPSKRI